MVVTSEAMHVVQPLLLTELPNVAHVGLSVRKAVKINKIPDVECTSS